MIIVFQGSIDLVGFVQRARLHWKYFANLSPSHFPAAGSSSSGTFSDNGWIYFTPIKSAESIIIFFFSHSGMNDRIMSGQAVSSVQQKSNNDTERKQGQLFNHLIATYLKKKPTQKWMNAEYTQYVLKWWFIMLYDLFSKIATGFLGLLSWTWWTNILILLFIRLF